VSIACLTTLCHSARSVAFHLSVCRSSLHQSVISSVHSRHGLSFRVLPSITPNTMAFNIRASFMRQMWPKNWSFLYIMIWNTFQLAPMRFFTSSFLTFCCHRMRKSTCNTSFQRQVVCLCQAFSMFMSHWRIVAR